MRTMIEVLNKKNAKNSWKELYIICIITIVMSIVIWELFKLQNGYDLVDYIFNRLGI